MGYINELRKAVGSRPVIMVGACVLILNRREQSLLLILRSDNGSWALPGGALEPGETLEQCAMREAYEETGLKLEGLKLLTIASGPELFYRYPNGDEVFNVSAMYSSSQYTGAVRHQPGESQDIRFFPLTAMPENLSPPDREMLKLLGDLKAL